MEDRVRPSAPRRTFNRRTAIALGVAAVASASLADRGAAGIRHRGSRADLIEALQPDIAPRRAWAGDLPVMGEILPEEDVRFLLVHHTASRNDYRPDEVAGEIRDFYRFHTGPEKGWPDVAYNFFVDRFGGLWEARAGSIDGAVRGDATGGSQGFALLCSLIGDHSQEPVSDDALGRLVDLLAWLAERHGVDTTPGATVDFVSRGSNRWPAGTEVTANTISGHRDMSQTTCPGDFAYRLVTDVMPSLVSDRRTRVAAETAPTSSAPGPDVTLQAPSTVTTATPTTGDTSAVGQEAAPAAGTGDGDDRPIAPLLLGVGATAVAVVVAGAVRLRGRAAG